MQGVVPAWTSSLTSTDPLQFALSFDAVTVRAAIPIFQHREIDPQASS